MDLHNDGSNYRLGKRKSLVVEDLAAYLADAIQSGAFSGFEREMPYLFNTRSPEAMGKARKSDSAALANDKRRR